ncbi:MAG: carboxypeptidase-like regulatory domain-containing protein [Bacteroidota bacterium]
MKKKSLLKTSSIVILLFVLFSINGNAQKVSGVIYDKNKKHLADVEVINQQNNFVTISNSDGSFTIKGNKNDVLLFIHPEKTVKTVTVDNIKNLKVYFDDEEKNKQTENKEQRKATRKSRQKEKITPIIRKDHVLNGNPLKNSVIGQIFDKSGPIPGANIIVKGTKISASTNFDGYYGIDAKIGDILIISYIGMKTVAVTINNKIMNVQLKNDTATLDEVVVIGYGTTKKSDLTGAVASVSGADLKKVASAMEISEKRISLKGGETSLKSGQLTAGEVNDFSHYEYWKGLTAAELEQWKKHWKLNPVYRYSISLKNDKGFPIINKTVHLKNGTEIIWTARTDNTGRAELWFNPNELSSEKKSDNLQIIDEKMLVLISKPKEFHDGINNYTYQQNCREQNKINIAFVIDATGSMGDEITYLQAELYDVIERTKKQFPSSDLSMGSVFYRDAGDEYIVKNFDFTTKISNVISFIKKQNANGGGDTPEAVIEALEASIENMNWDDDAHTRLLFLLLDVPPHYSDENVAKLQNLAKKAAAKGIRIIPIAASGIDKSTEYLMRAIALETNGTYLFITNHSGIGNDHIEPSTESYKVEMLNDLILRVIIQNCSVNNCNSKENTYSQNTKIEGQLTKNDAIDFKYFPNPTNDIINVILSEEAVELYLYDTTGKLILYRTDKSKEYKLDLSALPNAVYYLKVLIHDKELFGKIIKRN